MSKTVASKGDYFLRKPIVIKDVEDIPDAIETILDEITDVTVRYTFPVPIKMKDDNVKEDRFERKTYNLFGYKTKFLQTFEECLKEQLGDKNVFFGYNCVVYDQEEIVSINICIRFKGDDKITVNMFQCKDF